MGNVYSIEGWKLRHDPKTTGATVPLPESATVMLNDEALDIDPKAKTVDRYYCPEPEPDQPSVTSMAGQVIIDLGDVTPARTLLRFTPEAAEAWARELALASTLARERQGR